MFVWGENYNFFNIHSPAGGVANQVSRVVSALRVAYGDCDRGSRISSLHSVCATSRKALKIEFLSGIPMESGSRLCGHSY